MLSITRGIELHLSKADGRLGMGYGRSLNFDSHPLRLWLTFAGAVGDDSGFVVNVSHIKAAMEEALATDEVRCENPMDLLDKVGLIMRDKFSDIQLLRLQLDKDESMHLVRYMKEPTMVEVTFKYELAASHQLWNDKWNAPRNYQEFGKCANPAGHGHNYFLEVTLRGEPEPTTGQIIGLDAVDEVVEEFIIKKFDHKNLNEDIDEFSQLNPTVENMSKLFWETLSGKFGPVKLARIKVWETQKTFAEYVGE
ncbi:MAG: 6-carboxytetrahydropterin synthase [Phycisphaerae bacterium]|nr:6-carboxytetrahydropterin synthase [Phycisphaerae bacterium]